MLKEMSKKIRSEIEKIEKMDGPHKWEYFKSYYLKKALIALFLLICLIWMAIDMFFARVNVIYSGAILGCRITTEGEELLTSDFLKVIKPKAGKKDRVVISDDMNMSFMEEEQYNAQTADSALYTMLAAGEFNYLLVDEKLLDTYLAMDACYDLSDMVSNLQIDSTRCYTDNNSELLAIAISPEEQVKMGIEAINGGNVYIAFVRTGKSEEKDEMFLRYLLGI